MLYVAFGGALGTILRYLLGHLIIKKFSNSPIPISILFINLLGSFGLGSFLAFIDKGSSDSLYNNPFYLLLGIGFFGAFTTFSTFSMEARSLFQKKQNGRAITYISLTLIGSIMMVFLAMIIFGVGY